MPPDLLRRVENVTIVIERRPTAQERKQAGIGRGHTLLGLYTGIPLTQRGHESYNLVLPDRIFIYQEPIKSFCSNDEEVRTEVRKTVIHELAHYFGIDDDRLDQLGLG